MFLLALGCGSSPGDAGTDAGEPPDAAALEDAAPPPDAYIPPFELHGCSATPGDLVSMTQGRFSAMGVGPTHLYVTRREDVGGQTRTFLYAAPRQGGPMTRLAELTADRPELKSDGEHLFYRNRDWSALTLSGGPSVFFEGLEVADVEARDGMVYVIGRMGGQAAGLWRRPSANEGSAAWELVAEGDFSAPLDIANGYATMSGAVFVGAANGRHVYRVDLATAEVELWAWGRGEIGSVVADGDGVFWAEVLGNYRLTTPLIQPTFLFPFGWEGVGTMQPSPTHVDYVHRNAGVGYLSRYDRVSTQVTDLLTVPFSIVHFVAVGDYHFFMRPAIQPANSALEHGAVFRYDATNPSIPPLEISVPTFFPHTLATDGEYVYWTDQGELLHPGTIWRTRISDASTDKLLDVAWPQSLTMIGRVLYFINSSGVWSFDIANQQLVKLQSQQHGTMSNVVTDGESVYWGALLDSAMYRYQPGASAPDLLFEEVTPRRSLVVNDEYLYWMDGSTYSGSASVWRGRKDGSQLPERFLPHLDNVFSIYFMEDLLVFSKIFLNAFFSLPKSGTGLPPPETYSLAGIRTIGQEQWGTTSEGVVRRTPVTGELETVWNRGQDDTIWSFTVEDEHVFVLTLSQVLCITR